MADLSTLRQMIASESGLATFAMVRDDGSVHASVVNVGVLPHPLHGHDVVGAVVRGNAHKLVLARKRRRASITVRHGWSWAGVEGPLDIFGPDDNADSSRFDEERLRLLLRDVFTAAGGTHDDFDEYDRVMRSERRTALLVSPERIL